MTPSERVIALADLVMGEGLPEAEAGRQAVDPGLGAEASALRDVVGDLSLLLPATPPPTGLRARLMAATADPWWRGVEAFASCCDLGVDRVKAYMAAARTSGWTTWSDVGVDLFHLEGGPAVAGADVGFLRAPAGLRFPVHRHLGREVVVVLEGSMILEDRTVVAGQVDIRGVEDVHGWVAGPEGVVFAVVVHGGVELVGPTGASGA